MYGLEYKRHFSIFFSINHSIISKYLTPHTSTPLLNSLRILMGKPSSKSMVASFLLCQRYLDSLEFTCCSREILSSFLLLSHCPALSMQPSGF